MKKLIIVVVVLALLAVGAFVFWKKVVAHRPLAAGLVPAETVMFLQIPDTLTTVQRFTDTAFWKILQEPEIKRFLEKSRQKNLLGERWAEFNQRLVRTLPREGFAAVTSIDSAVPTFVAGFAFSGRKKHVEELAAAWRADLRKNWPAGRADLVNHGSREIETFTTKDLVLAETITNGWYLFANSVELLQETLDRLDRKHGTESTALARSEVYQQAIAPLPSAPDALLVAQLGTAMERISGLLVAAGQKADDPQILDLRKTRAIAASTKFDGAQCRDSIFILRTESPEEAPLARNSLALTTPETIFYYATLLPTALDLSEQTAPMLALVPGWSLLSSALAERQLSLSDLPKAFGPELGTVLEWPRTADTPSFLVTFDIRDAAKAAAFIDLATSDRLTGMAWTKVAKPDATLFTMTLDGDPALSPAIALTDKFAVFGSNLAAVEASLAQRTGQHPRLNGTAAFETASRAVTAPTAAFAYVDLPRLFTQAYSAFKPLLAVSLALSPEAGAAFDAGQMPSPESISQHLSPIVYSQSTSARGTLIESAGTLTLNQVVLGLAGGAIAVAYPSIEAALGSGTLLDPTQLLQGLTPGAGSPLPTPPTPAEAAASLSGGDPPVVDGAVPESGPVKQP